ncbi:cytochrome c biogenesis CcdA family protein [Magnetospirillum sp. SS-4]|uniref:cytochrome c biogenesis CcdA family protein n=1 Tax=Magnetospirillum sp. SS-4 TaxID=2681465 RepID=UPI00137EA237|nr:cytochrome c biogenesis protein CcdA [Magnetospirillum sp. SS-4]CAA7620150.1 putative cytochrome c-type biogenesis protein membrane protein [Magnetospirillum sp. SS-4]
MGANLAFGFLAGSLSTLSPCVLPLLPVLLGGALQQHRLAPVALAAGLATSFTAVGLFLATLGFAVGVDGSVIRSTAAVVMMAFGAVMLSSRLQRAMVVLAAPLTGGANGLLGRMPGNGLGGQFLLGILLGAVWSPCAGPTLGAAIGLAAQSGTTAQAALIMLVFSLGATAPMLALAYGSRQAVAARRHRLASLARLGKPIMGGVLLVMGLLVVTGTDKAIEAGLIAVMPTWLVAATTRF